MTTSIPILFKPIRYKEKEYCDGGIRHGYPYGYVPTPNYLGLFLNTGEDYIDFIEIPLVKTIIHILLGNEEKHPPEKRIIDLECNTFMNFHMDEYTKDKICKDAYNKAISHIETHLTKT